MNRSMLWTSPGSNLDLHRRNEAFLTLTVAGNRSISVRCTWEYKEQIYLGPQRRFGRTPPRFPFIPSLFIVRTLLTKTQLLLFIYNRNRLSELTSLAPNVKIVLKQEHLSLHHYLSTTPLLCHYSFTLSLIVVARQSGGIVARQSGGIVAR